MGLLLLQGRHQEVSEWPQLEGAARHASFLTPGKLSTGGAAHRTVACASLQVPLA